MNIDKCQEAKGLLLIHKETGAVVAPISPPNTIESMFPDPGAVLREHDIVEINQDHPAFINYGNYYRGKEGNLKEKDLTFQLDEKIWREKLEGSGKYKDNTQILIRVIVDFLTAKFPDEFNVKHLIPDLPPEKEGYGP